MISSRTPTILSHSAYALQSIIIHAENVRVDMYSLFGIDTDRCLRASKQHPRLTRAISKASSDALEEDSILSCNAWRGSVVV